MFGRAGKGAGAAREADFSFVGPEVTVTGDVATSGRIHLDGKVTGDVRCGGLTQGESGEVRGNIVAGEARLAGLVDGTVEAGILALEHSARVTGDVLYETLSIASGAQVEGRFKRRKGAGDGSAPAKATTTAAARPRAAELFAAQEAAE
ncbi:MAG: polymer-forming cytoskeletal protein [Alphaproteobacteria bacterium]|nr:polymer-forming cytoskeletal protein [Alphaproteobacteria bacterium]MBV9370328.1 polymer-forming cytoskeletal protein [Alphaproteobacteria bacterium]MBV9902015.1 polymer-forming cytoskeletal protein [Alphaproteobacteria bacterium]